MLIQPSVPIPVTREQQEAAARATAIGELLLIRA